MKTGLLANSEQSSYGPGWFNDKPDNIPDYEAHWLKKKEGRYCLGLGQWFNIFFANTYGKILWSTLLIVLSISSIYLSCVQINSDYSR